MTVFDKELNAWCERLAFVNYPEPLQLQATTDMATYERRKKVALQIQATDSHGFPHAGNFSLAVVSSGLDNPESRDNFYSNYFLQSELRGTIENPASYFEAKDSTGLQKIDMLLLTHGWRKYSWNDMMTLKRPEIRYPIETSLGFSGKVAMGRRLTKEQVSVTAFLRLDDLNEILLGSLENDGTFQFTGYHFNGMAQIVLSASDNKKASLNLSIDKPVFPTPAYYSPICEIYGESLKVGFFGSTPAINRDMENTVFELPEIQVTARAIRRNRNQLHTSDHNFDVYKVNENFSYSARSAFGQVGEKDAGALAILDQIPRARLLREWGRGAFSNSGQADIEPVFVLNGIRVTADALRSTPASLIERVELLMPAAALAYGSAPFAGAIAFYTKDLGHISRSMPSQTVTFQFPGYNQEKEFYAPDYSYPQTNFRPDYRKTLFWQPEVFLDKNGRAEFSFFTSDDRGEYIIHCEGISTTNKIGVSQSRFRVY
jgi:hypothetical protein